MDNNIEFMYCNTLWYVLLLLCSDLTAVELREIIL